MDKLEKEGTYPGLIKKFIAFDKNYMMPMFKIKYDENVHGEESLKKKPKDQKKFKNEEKSAKPPRNTINEGGDIDEDDSYYKK